jgi:hypothetical protein
MTAWKLFKRFGSYCVYSRINSTKYPASGAVNVNEARLMSQDGRMLKVVYAWISVFLQWRCQYSSAYVAGAVM